MDILDLVKQGQAKEAAALEEEQLFADEDKSLKVKKTSPFEFVASICDKQYSLTDENTKDYLPFMTNRSFSQHIDCIAHAYTMDMFGANLPKDMQYDYYYYAISKGKRYGKHAKADKHENVDVISEIYEVSKVKALEMMQLLSEQEIDELIEWYENRKGGRVK